MAQHDLVLSYASETLSEAGRALAVLPDVLPKRLANVCMNQLVRIRPEDLPEEDLWTALSAVRRELIGSAMGEEEVAQAISRLAPERAATLAGDILDLEHEVSQRHRASLAEQER